MNYKVLFLFILLSAISVSAKTIHIAVLDTGYTLTQSFNKCEDVPEYNATNESIVDIHGHGTNIIGIISERLKGIDYCIIPIKVFEKNTTGKFEQYINGLFYLEDNKDKIDIVNLSLSGEDENIVESLLLQSLLNKGLKIITAAGNNNKELNTKNCKAFPSCVDNRIISVGCLQQDGKTKCSHSNFGNRVTAWEIGDKVKGAGITMTGTSQATAVYTAKLAKRMNGKKK